MIPELWLWRVFSSSDDDQRNQLADFKPILLEIAIHDNLHLAVETLSSEAASD
jgi:hypothetical protein